MFVYSDAAASRFRAVSLQNKKKPGTEGQHGVVIFGGVWWGGGEREHYGGKG